MFICFSGNESVNEVLSSCLERQQKSHSPNPTEWADERQFLKRWMISGQDQRVNVSVCLVCKREFVVFICQMSGMSDTNQIR